ncbi:MAG: AsmA family protein [Candidatus Nitrosoglobus sp.]
MKKFLKILFSTLLVVILLIVIAIAVLPFIIDPNDFKPQIAAQVRKMTGRELTLGGDINLSIFPWLGVDLQKVSLSNPPSFGETPFAKADDMEVRVKLLPLLKKQVEMDTVVLSGLDLNLIRNANGKTNWEDLTATKPQEIPPGVEPPKESTGEEPSPLAGVAIAGLKIDSARISWRDEAKNTSYTIEHLNLATEPLVPGKPTQVKLACDFSSSQPNVSGRLDFGGNVTADMETNHYHLQDTDVKLTAAGPALPIEQLALQLSANIDAFLAKQQLAVSDLKLTSQVKGPQEMQLALNTSLEGNLATQQYRFNALQLDTKVKSPQLPKPLNATLTTAANMDLNKGTLTLQNLNLAALGIKLNGQINGTNLLTSPNFNGQIVSNQFNPRQTAQALAIELPPTADKGVLNKAQLALKFSASPKHFDAQRLIVKLDDSTLKGSLEGNLATQQYRFNALQLDTKVKSPQFPKPLSATLTTAANIDLKKGTLSLQNINLATLGIKLNGQINGTNLLTSPNFNGQIVSNQFNPRQTAQALAIELPPTADKGVLNKAQLTLKFSASPKHFDAQQLTVKLDNSTLKGSTAIHNFQQPAIRYDLALDAINADRYLPPPSKTTAPPATPTPPASPGAGVAASADSLPIEALRALNASGLLKIGELIISGTHSQDIRITLNAKDGLVKLNPLSAKLYQGTYAGDMRLDVRSQTPQLAIDEKLANIKAGPLLKDLTGDDKILGTANINAKLTANGATPEAIKHSLNGTAGFSFTDGAIKGINIARLIREATAAVEGKPIPPTTEPEKTDFTVLKGTITATNGLLKNTDLDAQSPLLRVGGQGTANLANENIDYRLDVAVVKTLKGQGGKGLADLKGVTIPLKISGTFTQPKYRVDLESIVKAKADKFIKGKKEVIEKKLEKGLDKLLGTQPKQNQGEAPTESPSPEQQLKEELKNKLKGIF